MVFYTKQYELIGRASQTRDMHLEELYFVGQCGFTLQYAMLLTPIKQGDSKEEIYTKLRSVASFLDILLNHRHWNWRTISYSTLQYSMFRIMISIRGKSSTELVEILKERRQKSRKI